MAPVEAAWVGALIEGEGCVSTAKGKSYHGHSIRVVMNNIGTIATLFRLVGGGSVRYIPPRNDGLHKECWSWSVQSQADILYVGKQILPYVEEKFDKLSAALLEIETRGMVV